MLHHRLLRHQHYHRLVPLLYRNTNIAKHSSIRTLSALHSTAHNNSNNNNNNNGNDGNRNDGRREMEHMEMPNAPPATETKMAGDDEVMQQFDGKSYRVIKVDKSALVKKGKPYMTRQNEQEHGQKEAATPLIEDIKSRIKGGGPMSVSSFMHDALLHPKYGYYTTAGVRGEGDQRIFGSQGDFVTSPEISQMFGEMVGLWCMSMWDRMGRPDNLRVVELGPGKGTLMYDMLRTTRKDSGRLSSEFHEFHSHIAGVHLVEASPELQKIQMDRLKQGENEKTGENSVHTFGNIPVQWHTSFDHIPSDGPILLVAHEFFDALPVYQFEYTERGWCEVLVDVDDDPNSEHHFKFVLAPGKSWASVFLQVVKAPKVKGTRIEIAPSALSTVEQIARRISNEGGSALVVDYGHNESMGFTLQGIKKHDFVHPLSDPGTVDLSTYVDFGMLRDIVERYQQETVDTKKEVVCHGPQTQGDFLYEMGIDARLVTLLKNPRITDQEVEYLTYAYEKLTSAKGMGTRFKVMSITEALPNKEASTGFEICPPLPPLNSTQE